MKALTICQPYAHLIRCSEKLIENRSWPTKERGLIYIHAGKSRAWLNGEDTKGMAFGAIVAIAELYDCVRLANLPPELKDDEHANGPWCFLLRNVTPIGPWPYKGAQGFFEVKHLDLIANKVLFGIKQPSAMEIAQREADEAAGDNDPRDRVKG
jgi:hypothetical protein